MNKYNQIISLLDDIINKVHYYDSNNINIEKTSQYIFNKMLAGGDSWDLHHLKVLKNLIEEYEKEKNAKS